MSRALGTQGVSLLGGGGSSLDGISPELVGFKAYNLMRMDYAGLPVPPGFVLHTRLCREYFANGYRLSDELVNAVRSHIRLLEESTGLLFGDSRRPLLVSVRSGAPVSMPGMMDTLLDIGLGGSTLEGLIRRTGNPHLAWDSYRRLVAAYTETVEGGRADFDGLMRGHLAAEGLRGPDELDTRTLRDLTRESLIRAREAIGRPFLEDPYGQLLGGIEAVFRSWNSERAVAYRRMYALEDVSGTAVIVQAMVFGNSGGTSGSGVGFTRNPATGADELYFDFAFDAQGEDVVDGRHSLTDPLSLARVMPGLYADLLRIRRTLELEFGDMQDFEFTVENGTLYLLQTRPGKRTPLATVRIALAMAEEGLIQTRTALARIADVDLDSLNADRLDPGGLSPLALAVSASTGVAVGPIALDSVAAKASAMLGDAPILIRAATSTEDIEGLAAAAGVLTATGGRTSHAAVVARQMGKVCLVGCPSLEIDLQTRTCTIGGRRFAEGDPITLDASSGRVYAGRVPVLHGPPLEEIAAIERLQLLEEPPLP